MAIVRPATDAPEAPRFDRPLASRLSREAAYAELSSLGIQYGPAFQGIEWLSREGEGVLASVRMPEGLHPEHYFFHPALHDAALHVAVLAEPCRGHSGVLPVRIQRIWIASRPTGGLVSHASVTRIGDRLRADIRVESESGQVVEIVEGIELAHLDDAILDGRLAPEEASWLYSVEWRSVRQSDPPDQLAGAAAEPLDLGSSVAAAGAWLIVADRQGIGAALSARIRASGGEACTLTLHSPGGDLRRTTSESGRKQELVQAISSLLPPKPRLAGVIHLSSLDLPSLEDVRPEQLDAAAVESCGSAARLLGALEEILPDVVTPVWFVTRGAQAWALEASEMAPLQATLWGLARAVAAELPSRWGGLVDLDPAAAVPTSATMLWDWIRASREGEDEVLFRRAGTYAARLVRRAAGAHKKLEIRSDASYLITGGTGGLGLAVARWLACRGARHLVLAARTPLPPRDMWPSLSSDSPHSEAVRAIVDLEALGAGVKPVRLDIGDEGAVIEFLNEHDRNGNPPFRGVLHLAGTMQIEDALRLSTPLLSDTLRSKVKGALVVHRWFEDLDFLVLFSSAASVIRSPRLGHYAAGNAFLDAMAHYRRARGQPALAVNWGLWSDVGFIRRLGDRGPAAMGGMKSIPPEAGIRVLDFLVETEDVQTVVWPPDWGQWAQLYPSFVRSSFVADLLSAPTMRPKEESRGRLALFGDLPAEERPSAMTAHVARISRWSASDSIRFKPRSCRHSFSRTSACGSPSCAFSGSPRFAPSLSRSWSASRWRPACRRRRPRSSNRIGRAECAPFPEKVSRPSPRSSRTTVRPSGWGAERHTFWAKRPTSGNPECCSRECAAAPRTGKRAQKPPRSH